MTAVINKKFVTVEAGCMRKNSSPNKLIWILEDSSDLVSAYQEFLSTRYELRLFERISDMANALKGASRYPDLFLLDVHLPDGKSPDFFKKELEMGRLCNVPVLFVSGDCDHRLIASCLSRPFCDYLTKPVRLGEFLSKIARMTDHYEIVLNPLELTVTRRNRTSGPLTSKEYQILSIFQASTGRQVKRTDLYQCIWGKHRVTNKTLDVHLSNLRKKLRPIGVDIYYSPSDSTYQFVFEGKLRDFSAEEDVFEVPLLTWVGDADIFESSVTSNCG